MQQPKWFRSDKDVKVGDIVLFLKKDHEYSGHYQYGVVDSVEVGRDGKIRTVWVWYRNHTESKGRRSQRAVKELIVIHHTDEIGIFEELADASKTAHFTYLNHDT